MVAASTVSIRANGIRLESPEGFFRIPVPFDEVFENGGNFLSLANFDGHSIDFSCAHGKQMLLKLAVFHHLKESNRSFVLAALSFRVTGSSILINNLTKKDKIWV